MNTMFFKHAGRALAAMVLAGVCSVSAQAQYIGGDLSLDLDDSGDVFILAADVTLNGRVGGDVDGFAADVSIDADIGGDINIGSADFRQRGRVGGDINIGAADITIEGDVLGDANLGAADIAISGRIHGDLNAGGASVVLGESAFVGGEAEIGGRDVVVRGQIMGETRINGREVHISGEIAGPLDIEARNVYFDEGASVAGPVTVRSQNEPVIAQGVVMPEAVTFTRTDWTDREFGDYGGPKFKFNKVGPPAWAFSSVFAFSAFVLGMLAVLIAPRSVGHIATAFRRRPWVSGLLGLVVLAVSPVLVLTLMVLLMVTIIGIPLGLILIFAYPVVLFLGFAFGGMAVGDLVFNRKGGQAGLGLRALSFFVAIIAIAAFGAIPVLGWVLGALVLCIGLGAWSIAIFSRQSNGAPPAPALAEPAGV